MEQGRKYPVVCGGDTGGVWNYKKYIGEIQMNEEKILWTGRQNMKAALMSALINFFLLVAAVWLLANKNNLAKTWENYKNGVDTEFSVFMLCLYLAPVAIYVMVFLVFTAEALLTKYIITDKGVYIKCLKVTKIEMKNVIYINPVETSFSGICQTKQIELVTKKKCWQGGYDDDFTFMKNLADADEAYRILRSVQDRVYAEMGFAVSDAQKNGETYRMRSHEEQHRRYMLR